MVVYNILLRTIKGTSKYENDKGWSKTIESARKRAVMMLIERDKLGQVALIYRDKKPCGTVSMQTGPDTYVKPSTGLAKGIQFMYDDGEDFYTCYMNGKVKRW